VGKVYEEVGGPLRDWLLAQPVFFVGTAPSGDGGHVNVSPKGGSGVFRALGPTRVAYLDYVGSGIETVAHLRENGRIVLMFCAFEGPPRIVRLHGRGRAALVGSADYDTLLAEGGFAVDAGVRGIVEVDVTRIADSCGYGVPLMRLEGERPQREAWVDRKLRQGGPNGVLDYAAGANERSLDGLPGIELALLPRR
jgi:hypothetical protein